MNFEVEELPSGDIKIDNCISRVNECQDYLINSQWGQFIYLFKLLLKFNNSNKYELPEDFTKQFDTLKTDAKSNIIRNLELATVFEDFKEWLTRLSEIVQDKEELWSIMHTQAQMSIRVTMKQNQEICSLFFSPNFLFEFGVKAFMESNVCDWKNPNEESLVDNFYGVAGFVRACGLSPTYESNNPDYHAFVKKILVSFVTLPEFDPHRFVWLVEACNGNLRLPPAKFREICEEVLDYYSNLDLNDQLLDKLYKFSVFSTSPLMQGFPVIKTHINDSFSQLIEGQRNFCRRYIFACFSTIEWTGPSSPNLCDQLKCWTLFVTNVSTKLKERPELPEALLQDLIDDSMCFFEVFFADAQPTKEKVNDMKMWILHVAETVQQNYPGTIKEATLHRVWYILFIAAIAGALDHELKGIKFQNAPKDNTCLLGLEHSSTDFTSYQVALSVLGKKFEPDSDTLEKMTSFVRANIKS